MYSFFEIIPSTDDDVVDLIDLATLKAALGITGTDEDESLAVRITLASRMIAEYCDRTFALSLAQETIVFQGSDIDPITSLQLKLYPVREFVSVSAGDLLTRDTDFDANLDTGQIKRLGGWWGGRVVVTYYGGYQLPDEAPAMLAAACIEEVRVKRSSSGRDPSIRDVGHGDTRVGFYSQPMTTNGLASSAADLARSFKRLTIA